MELVPVKPAAGALVEVGSGSVAGAGSIPAMVAAQQELLHEQVVHLQRLVVAQCRLTGVNPLAQEMAAGALSIKIGKRPRDLLNPKAVNYMQSLFALKDTLGKKETREISLLCGVTVTQVREFFTIQKSRVRKFVRLSQEKALRIETPKEQDDAYSINTEQIPLDIEAQAEVIEPLSTLEPVVLQSSLHPTDVPQVSLQSMELQQSDLQHMEVFQNSLQQAEVHQNFAAPMVPSGTMVMQPTDAKISSDSVRKEIKQEEVHPGVESEDKKFLESIFALMQKEETFSGQVKLMEWILQINNVTVLSRFVTMDGLTIMSTWLSQAAIEEQTSVIHVIFKVLLHLPLHKALPVHMSVVLQTINRLRFYRTQDISSRARNLLSRLSKVLVRIQALKKPQKDLICKQRISEILRDESWKSEVDITEEILALTNGANESRKPEPRKTPMLLTASADEANKRSFVQTKSKQKRKVLLVEHEHPNKKAVGKNANSVRNTSTNNSRPLSADDIQKAKMRAMFMQEKYGKIDTNKDKPQALETQKAAGLVNSNASPMPISPHTSAARPVDPPSASTSKQSTDSQPDNTEISGGLKLNIGCKNNVIEKLDSKRVLWQMPPAVWIDPSWSVGAGDNSKEVEVQTRRNRREKETFYASQKDIPMNPKDPWDLEMDFDDSLTPEIPIDQVPDADAMETDSVRAIPNAVAPVKDKQIESTSTTSGAVADGAGADADYELLTVLLKNPELVFALTSNNKGENMPNEQTIALLDTLKQTGLSLSELVNSLGNGAGFPKEQEPEPEPIPTSLPSPTPPDRTSRAVWRPEHPVQVRAPNLQQPHVSGWGNTPPIANAMQQSFSNVVSSLPSQPYASVSVLPTQIQANTQSLPQLAVSVNPPIQHVPPGNNHLNRALVHQHNQQYALLSDPVATPLHQQAAVSKSTHGLQSIPNPAVARSSLPEPNAYNTTLPWESSAADITHTGRNAAADTWAARTTNSYNTASANTVPFGNQNAYGDQSSHIAYSSYGAAAVSSHSVVSGHGHDRNGYSRPPVAEYQSMVQDGHRRHSRSPDPGVVRDYGGTQGYNQQHRTHWSAGQGQQSYSPEPSRQWSSSQAHQGYTPANSSRQWSSAQQSYTPEPSRQWSSERQGYSVEPSRSWSSGKHGQNPEASRQWNRGKQDPYHNPSDGRRSYDQHRRR